MVNSGDRRALALDLGTVFRAGVFVHANGRLRLFHSVLNSRIYLLKFFDGVITPRLIAWRAKIQYRTLTRI